MIIDLSMSDIWFEPFEPYIRRIIEEETKWSDVNQSNLRRMKANFKRRVEEETREGKTFVHACAQTPQTPMLLVSTIKVVEMHAMWDHSSLDEAFWPERLKRSTHTANHTLASYYLRFPPPGKHRVEIRILFQIMY